MFEEVKAMLTEQLHLVNKEVLPTSRIKEDLGADSLDILQLLMTIEEEKESSFLMKPWPPSPRCRIL